MRSPVIAVVGGGGGTVLLGSAVYELVAEVGWRFAEAGAVLLCGGGGGVMEALVVAARAAGGHMVGVLLSWGPANLGIEHAVFTGMGSGCNYLNAAVVDAMIVFCGEAGTLSEVALAIKVGTPVVYLDAWSFLNDHGLPPRPHVTTPRAAIDEAFRLLGLRPGERLDRPLKRPSVPDQTGNLEKLARVVERW